MRERRKIIRNWQIRRKKERISMLKPEEREEELPWSVTCTLMGIFSLLNTNKLNFSSERELKMCR